MIATTTRATEGKVLGTTPAGEVELVANLYGIVDTQNDVLELGVFSDSLKTRPIRIIDSHNTHSTLSAIATPLDVREIGRGDLPPVLRAKFPESTGGLYVKAQFMLDIPESEGTFKRIRAGAISEFSIGFDVLESRRDKALMSDGTSQMIRRITRGTLYEVSCVLFGANQGTAVISAKAARRWRLPSEVMKDYKRVARAYDVELKALYAGRGNGPRARRLELEKRMLRLELDMAMEEFMADVNRRR